jgi:sulfotransferase family protein
MRTTSFGAFRERIAHEPVWVVLGVQGSGTNLLSRVLERTLGFSLIEDGSVIFKACAHVGDQPAPVDVRREFAAVRARLLPSTLVRKTRRLVKSNTTFHGIDDHFDVARMSSGADLARFVYGYGAFRLGTERMAIKSDDLWEDIDRIDAVLPNRRIVLLTRDFRDNVLSVANKDFGPIEPLIAARFVKRQFAIYEAEYHRTAPEFRWHLRYEDLLESPFAVVRALNAHFRLPFVDGWEQSLSELHIRRGNVEKWRAMPPRLLGNVETMLARELRRYGYGLTSRAASLPTRPAWAAALASDAFWRLGQKTRHIAKRLAR